MVLSSIINTSIYNVILLGLYPVNQLGIGDLASNRGECTIIRIENKKRKQVGILQVLNDQITITAVGCNKVIKRKSRKKKSLKNTVVMSESRGHIMRPYRVISRASLRINSVRALHYRCTYTQ